MTMDAVTEKIAHFIGAFAMIEQAARLRSDHDAFRAAKAAEDEARILDLQSFKGKQAHSLDDYDPKLKLDPLPVKVPTTPADAAKTVGFDAPLDDPLPVKAGQMATAPMPAASGAAMDAAPPPVVNVTYTMNPPGSVASIVLQTSTLSDNDSFGNVHHAGFQDLAPLVAALDHVMLAGRGLGLIHLDLPPATDAWMATVKDLVSAATQITPTDTDTLHTSVFVGAAAQDIFVNGERVDALPSLDDYVPDFIARANAAAEQAADAAADGLDLGRAFGGEATPDAPPAPVGHTVTTGANTLLNAASVNVNWLDAKVIAVAGDVVRFDGISQVNVLIDHDRITDAIAPQDMAAQASTVVNAAAISVTPTTPAGAPGKGGPFVPPENWAVVHYEGSVTQLNWIKQHNFITDFDRAEVTFSGQTTFLGMGQNDMFNVVDFAALGYGYDLILVGGNLIDINLISQLNVLLDSDELADSSAGSGIAGASAAPGGTVQAGAASAGDPAGHATDDTPDKGTDDPPPFSTGDNLLYNQASIDRIGLDTDAAMTAPFARALDDFANGGRAVGDNVLRDAHFDGVELLRVLYVDGDFTSVNLLDQINVLGDADQVHLARDDFAAALQQQIQVTTGSNVLANLAAIRDQGIDSTVMARGTTYSDVLLHQANLVDTGTDTLGRNLSDLATEAVAFLVDDLIPDNMAADIGAQTHDMIADTMAQADGMQSMLA